MYSSRRQPWTLNIDSTFHLVLHLTNTKNNSDAIMTRHKVWLVAQGFMETYEKLCRYLFSYGFLQPYPCSFILLVTHNLPLHQMDISNAFICRQLNEQLFMEKHPMYVSQGETLRVYLLCLATYKLEQNSLCLVKKVQSPVVHL